MRDRPPATPLLIAATIDCTDLEGMTGFWGELLDVEFQVMEPFGFLAHAPDRKVTIWLQQVPEEKAGKNRVHLDFVAADMEAAVEKVISLGGSIGERQQWHDYTWTTCMDPEGNVFDIMQAQQPEPEQDEPAG